MRSAILVISAGDTVCIYYKNIVYSFIMDREEFTVFRPQSIETAVSTKVVHPVAAITDQEVNQLPPSNETIDRRHSMILSIPSRQTRHL